MRSVPPYEKNTEFSSENTIPVSIGQERHRTHPHPQQTAPSYSKGASRRQAPRMSFVPLKSYFHRFGICGSLYRSEKSTIRVLVTILFIVILVNLVLAALCAYLLIYGNGKFSRNTPKMSNNDEALMSIWRLYHTALRTNDEYHKKALRDFIDRNKVAIEDREANHSGKKFKRELPDPGFPSETIPDLDVFQKDSPKELRVMLHRIRSILDTLEKRMPEDGLQRVSAFIESHFLTTDEIQPLKIQALREDEDDASLMRGIADNEEEVLQPVDDLELLQLREYIERHKSGGYPVSNLSSLSVESLKQKIRHLTSTVSSVHGGKFFYPSRRHSHARPYTKETPETNAAWYDALRYHYIDRHGLEEPKPIVVPPLTEEYIKAVQPYIANHSARENTATIYVNVASYRDVECWPMIDQMRRRAVNFHRVFFGIAEQHLEGDEPCLRTNLLEPFPCASSGSIDGGLCFAVDNVRIRRIRPSSARGPTYGRYMSMLLFNGEDFAMIIDSHNRYVFAWDTRFARLYLEMEHPKLILSHYPASFVEGDSFEYEQQGTAYLCDGKFLDDLGYIRLKGILIGNADDFNKKIAFTKAYAIPDLKLNPNVLRKLPQPWAAGGLVFGNASIYREVPFDPHLEGLFDGEEILFSVRLWTHGYDLHSPRKFLCYHTYGRAKAPKVWTDSKEFYKKQKVSQRRVQYYLRSRIKGTNSLRVPRHSDNPGVLVDVDRYGMGRMRTVDDWYKFAGANPMNYTFDNRWCSNK